MTTATNLFNRATAGSPSGALLSTFVFSFVASSGMLVCAQNPLRSEPTPAPEPKPAVARVGYNEPSTTQQLERSPSLAAREGRRLLHDAYTLSQTAKSQEEVSEVIKLCTSALKKTLSPDEETYAKQLAAWGHNKRGELLAEQAAKFADEGDDKTSAHLDREALQDFSAAIKLEPGRWKAIYNRGVAYGLLGLTEDAISDFTAVIKLKPDHADAWFNRAELHGEIHRPDLAAQDYQQVTKRKPDDAASHFGLAESQVKLGKKQEALASFNKAIQLDANDARYYVGRGTLQVELRKWQAAQSDFEAAVAIDPDCAAAYRGSAWLQATCPIENVRNARLALENASRAVQLAKAQNCLDAKYFDALAAAEASAGRFKDAQRFAELGLKLASASLAQDLAKRRDLYAAGKPYRMAAGAVALPASARVQRR